MNTVDEQLRSAARAARKTFPPGGEMPPLRLPGAAARHDRGTPRGSGALAFRRTRVWLAPTAAVAAVAVVIAGIVALQGSAGQDQRAASTRRSTTSQTALARQHQLEQRRSLDALVVAAFAPATGPQYDQGTRLMWLVHGKEYRADAKCMAAAGYHISGASQPFNLGSYADNTQWPDLPRIARTHEFVPPGGLTSADLSKAERRVFNSCLSRASLPYQGLVRLGTDLLGSWWKVVMPIQSSARVRAALPALSACAGRYGFPSDPYGNATGPIKSFADFMDWVAGFLDGAGSRGASAATMRSLARHWTGVFLTCARPIVGIFQRMQVAAQPAFLQRNANRLSQLDHLAWRLLGPQPRRS